MNFIIVYEFYGCLEVRGRNIFFRFLSYLKYKFFYINYSADLSTLGKNFPITAMFYLTYFNKNLTIW